MINAIEIAAKLIFKIMVFLTVLENNCTSSFNDNTVRDTDTFEIPVRTKNQYIRDNRYANIKFELIKFD
uniref:Uncharacterized protein n=1 Tax=Romanomermis culicivorax TaxID=13658 RepID=A0A915HH58_ROMCU